MKNLFSIFLVLFFSLNSFCQDPVEEAATLIDKGEYEKAIVLMTDYIAKKPKDEKAYLNRGIAYIYNEELAKAIEDFNVVISYNNKDADIYNKRGYCYLNDGKPDMAILDFQKAIALDDKYFSAYENLGMIAANREDYKTAIDWYTKSIKVNPSAYLSFVSRGDCYRLSNQYEKAYDDLKLAVELQPKTVDAYQKIAQLYQQQGLVDKTLEAVLKCIDIDPKNSINLINASSIYLDKGDFEKSKKYALKAKEINPNNPDCDEFLVMIEYANKNYEAARDLGAELSRKFKAGAKTYNILGLYYWEHSNNHDTAAYFFKLAIDKDKFYVYPYKNISDIFAHYKLTDDALEGYSIAIRLAPSDADAYNKRGMVYLEQKSNYLLAESDFKAALNIEPKSIEYKNNYGRVFMTANPEKAIGLFDEIIKVEPKYTTAYYNKAIVKINAEKYKEAIILLNRTIELNDQLMDAFFVRGYCHILLEDYKAGKNDYIKFVSVDDKNSMAYNNLGMCYMSLKDDKLAESNFTRSIELDEKNSVAYFNRAKIKLAADKKTEACADLKMASEIGHEDAMKLMEENCK